MGERIQNRRPVLKHVSARDATNASLWLDKYIYQDVPSDAEKPEKTLVNEAAKIPISAEYEKFYKRWKQLLEAKCPLPPEEAAVQGRLAIGIGAESVLETSIALHRTYGVPYIPGSALKGLAAHYARNYLDDEWSEGVEAYRTLFGDTDSAGYITFFDALYVPDSGHNKQALWPDVITVHHKEYYQGKENSPPADWDSPTPIHFLSATGRYLIALDGPNKEWVKTAFEVLGLSLAELGVGAKTTSGYGIMILGDQPETHHKESYVEKRNRLLSEDDLDGDRVRSLVREVKEAGEYGFCDAPGGGKDIYLKPTFFKFDDQKLQEGQLVEYQIVETESGPQARDMIVLLEPE